MYGSLLYASPLQNSLTMGPCRQMTGLLFRNLHKVTIMRKPYNLLYIPILVTYVLLLHVQPHMGVSIKQGVQFGGPCCEGCCYFGSMLDAPGFGKLPCRYTIDTLALRGLPHHDFGIYACTMKLLGSFENKPARVTCSFYAEGPSFSTVNCLRPLHAGA